MYLYLVDVLKIMADEILDRLQDQQYLIDAQIKARKREIAKERGEVFDSIDELVCERHPGAVFKAIKTISDSLTYIPGKENAVKLNVYQCEPCGEEVSVADKSKAYDCPNCGIVVGRFNTRFYRSPEESWRAFAGREGEHYHCRVCDTQLGSFYLKVS